MPSRGRAGFWLLAQVAVVLIAALPFVIEPTTPTAVLELTQARLDAAPGAVPLPDDWHQRGATAGAAVYELLLPLAQAPEEPWAVLITSLRMSAELAINDQRLLYSGSHGESAARLWFRPILYAVPTGVLQSGDNRLRIALTDETGRGYLAAPLVGPLTALAPLARQHELWRPTLLTIIVIAMTAVGVLMLLLWTQRPGDVVYGLYGLGMLAWAAHDATFLLTAPALPPRFWDALSDLALGGFILATTFFIHRYLELRRPRLERAVLLLVSGGGVLLFVLPDAAFRAYADYLWRPAILAVGLYLYLRIYVAAWQRGDGALHLLAMTGSVMVLYGARDSLVSLGALPWGLGFLLPYSAAPSLVLFTALLTRRFALSLNAMEATARELDGRVRAATRELEANHQRLRELERQGSLNAERERVARDIHDGVGGQLVALLARLKHGSFSPDDAESALSQALQDLRLVIESLDIAEGDLGTALATWRHRLERRLDGSAIRLTWKPTDIARLPGFGPSEILSVLRLLDEAATNVLRHAKARTLTVGYTMAGAELVIEMADDGCGGALESPHGRGIHNMRHRAHALGARLEIDSGTHGTTIRLRLPPRSTRNAAV